VSTDRQPAVTRFVFQCDHANYAEAREQAGVTVCEHCLTPLKRSSNPPPKAPSK